MNNYQNDNNPQISLTLLSLILIWLVVMIVVTASGQKIVAIGPILTSVAVIFYPITYIISDTITEVYGYKTTRRVIWFGLISIIIFSLSMKLTTMIPSAENEIWKDDMAYNKIFGMTMRMGFANISGYFCGEFVNSFVLSKLKVITEGKYLSFRTLISSVFGQIMDNLVAFTVAFLGILKFHEILLAALVAAGLCVLYEVVLSVWIVKFINKIKEIESLDTFDRDIEFSPFKF